MTLGGVIRYWIPILSTGVALAVFAAVFWQVWSTFTDRDALLAKWPGVELAPTVSPETAAAMRREIIEARSAARTEVELSLTRTSPISTSSLPAYGAPDAEDLGVEPSPKVRRTSRRKKRRARRRVRRGNWVENFHNQHR